MAPPKKKAKPEPDHAELPDALEEQVKRHAACLESILELLRFLAPALPGLLLADPSGVDKRIRDLKNPGGKRAGELLNDDES